MDQLQQMLAQDNMIEEVVVKKVSGHQKHVHRSHPSSPVHHEKTEPSNGVLFVEDKDDDFNLIYDNSMDLEDGEELLYPNGTFDSNMAMAQQEAAMLQMMGVDDETQTEGESDVGVVHTVASVGTAPSKESKEIVTQTAINGQAPGGQVFRQQSSGSTNELGTLGHLMESMGLFGASVCMGTSRAMLSCADSCSDNPQAKAHQRLRQGLSLDEADLVERLVSRRGARRMMHCLV